MTLGVSVDDDLHRARRFASAHAGRFPLLLDPRKGVAAQYRVDNLPMTVLIDRAGACATCNRDLHGATQVPISRRCASCSMIRCECGTPQISSRNSWTVHHD